MLLALTRSENAYLISTEIIERKIFPYERQFIFTIISYQQPTILTLMTGLTINLYSSALLKSF